MQLTKVLTKSLHDYKSNPVLLIPSLVGTIGSFLVFGYFRSYMGSVTGQVGTSRFVGLAESALGFSFLLFSSVIIGLLVLLGQVSMTGKVIHTGKTRLGDWWVGLRKYFWRVFGIGAVYFGVVMGITIIAILIFVFIVIVPAVMSNSSSFSSQSTPFAESPFLLGVTFLSALGSLVFYMMLAPVVIDDRGVGSSISSGLSAVKRGGRTFLAFLGLVLLETLVVLEFGYRNLGTNPTYPSYGTGFLTFPMVFSGLLGAAFSPLWVLMAFRIYCESGVREKFETQVQSGAMKSKVCLNCNASIPSFAKYCPNCGTSQA